MKAKVCDIIAFMSKKLQKKPNAFIYYVIGIFYNAFIRIRFKIRRKGVKPKGPALILSNHTSNHDYKFVISSAYPRRINFVVSYYFFTFKKLAWILKLMGAIPKLQFATDLESIKKIRYVVQKNKGLIFIAPEGTIYANGKLGYISPAIAKIIRFLKVPVYTTKIEGAGLGNCKWNKVPHRSMVQTTTDLIITKEESTTLPPEEIMKRINEKLSYNEFDFQKANNIRVKKNHRAEGFEDMFYKCPVCGKEFSLETNDNTIKCKSCGLEVEINEQFRFNWKNHEKLFDTYVEWYDWQYEEIKKEYSYPDFEISSKVDYATDKPGADNYVKRGSGVMTLNHDGWTYNGTFDGQNITEHDELKAVPLATLKTGVHFELPYRFEHSRVFYPENGKLSMKYHLVSRAITELAENN